MTDTELPWRIAGRPLRPFAFALMLACLTMLTGFLFRETTGQVFDAGTVSGAIMTAAAAVASAALAGGWWLSSDRWMRVGLLSAFGLWTAIAAGLTLDIGLWTNSVLLSWSWAVAAGGAWLLEAADTRRSG